MAAITPSQDSPRNKPKGPNIQYTRLEVSRMTPKWELVEDCLEGQDKIKSKEDVYLPRPNASDTSEDNKLRYMAYLLRAVFYNVTRKTLEGLVGQVCSRDPIVVMPDTMTAMKLNVDGNGVSLDQQAKKGLAMNIAYGRFGLLVDYPKTLAPISLADQKAGRIHPTILQYPPKSIINWRTAKVGADDMLTLVVLSETGILKDDGFEITAENQYRTLELKESVCVMTTWRWSEAEKEFEVKEGPHVISDAAGKPFDHIPFYFCGSVDNDPDPDHPPLYDLANLNIAHYRNSADYEEACYVVGQPTFYFAGLTENWVKNVFKGKAIQIGSRAAVPLPVGGTAGILQVSPNSMPKEAMDQKEAQMLAMGAKILEPGGGSNTFGQAQLDESNESSMLATVAKNVSAVYTAALKDAAKMQGVPETEISYSLNTDFPASRQTPNERTQTVLEWQAGAITETEMRASLRKAGVATLDHKEYKAELVTNPPPDPKEMKNNGGKGGSENDPKKNKDEKNNGGNQAGN